MNDYRTKTPERGPKRAGPQDTRFLNPFVIVAAFIIVNFTIWLG